MGSQNPNLIAPKAVVTVELATGRFICRALELVALKPGPFNLSRCVCPNCMVPNKAGRKNEFDLKSPAAACHSSQPAEFAWLQFQPWWAKDMCTAVAAVHSWQMTYPYLSTLQIKGLLLKTVRSPFCAPMRHLERREVQLLRLESM